MEGTGQERVGATRVEVGGCLSVTLFGATLPSEPSPQLSRVGAGSRDLQGSPLPALLDPSVPLHGQPAHPTRLYVLLISVAGRGGVDGVAQPCNHWPQLLYK